MGPRVLSSLTNALWEASPGYRCFCRYAPFVAFTLLIAFVAAGCGPRRRATIAVPPTPPSQPTPSASSRPPAPSTPVVPGSYVEQGVASWYGYPFDGRRAADGEVYDMKQPVAAHRTLPFGSVVRVTNLRNGLTTDVRIIDRGPFAKGRIIDLSFAAAKLIDMVGTGTAQVRVELISSPSAPAAGYFCVQIGAFQQRENAERLRDQLLPTYPVALQEYDNAVGHFYRVRVGREPSQETAQKLAATLASQEKVETFVVRLDDVPNAK
jgi:peptidoglycan lytic transglycosylase